MVCDINVETCNAENDSCWLDVLLNYGNPTNIEKTGAFEYARQNFMEIVKKDDFLQLDLESFKTLLRSDELNVSSEDVVFECVKRWLDFNNVNSYDSLDSLLEVVRLPLVSIEVLLSNVLPFAYPITNCRVYVMEALRWHLQPEQRSQISKDRTHPRRPVALKLFAVGSTAHNSSPIIELYDFGDNKWTQLKRLNIRKKNFAAVLVEQELLLIGGLEGRATKSVLSVNLMNGEVTNVGSLNDARYNFWATVVQREQSTAVYVVGGHGTQAINGVEKWDSVSRQWSRMAPMNFVRESCGVTYLDGKIYAAGGIDKNTFHNILEVYDIKLNAWQVKAPMNQVRSYCTLATAGKYIYAIGGHNQHYRRPSAIKSVERYDPKSDGWMNIASISSSGFVGATTIGSNIIIAGGYASNILEEFNSVTNQTKRLSPLKFNRDHVNIIPLTFNLSTYQFKW